MFPLSKGWMMVAAFGHGVLMALALGGLVRIAGWMFDFDVPERLAGNIFLIASLTLGTLFVFLYLRSLRLAAADGQNSPMLDARE